VAEAVTGVISLEASLTVLGYFGALPPRVRIIEVEAADPGWGPGFSRAVAAQFDALEALVTREVEALRYERL
jgi:hypothetical protein